MDDFRLLLPSGHGIMASVDETGLLSFVVVAGKDCPISGTEMFDLMMRAFGERIRAIAGVWRRGFEDKESTNLDEVNRLTASGASLDEAATRTWTATRASRWGFTKMTVVRTVLEVGGTYSKIDVIFERPKEPS